MLVGPGLVEWTSLDINHHQWTSGGMQSTQEPLLMAQQGECGTVVALATLHVADGGLGGTGRSGLFVVGAEVACR